MAPLLVFDSTFPTSIMIGGTFDPEAKELVGGVSIPVCVKRLSRAEVDAIESAWMRLMEPPRGAAPAPVCAACQATGDKALAAAAEAARRRAWHEETEKERGAFVEQVVRDYVTLDAGLIEYLGKPITDGAGLVDVFYARKEVLAALAGEVYIQNRMVGIFAKNLNSLRVSGTGSAASAAPARSGNAQEPTAGNADSSSSAPAAGATGVSAAASADASPSSGRTTASDLSKVH